VPADEEVEMAKYMLLMTGPQGNWQDFLTLPEDDLRAHIQFMADLNEDLRKNGEFVDGQGLAFPDQAKIVSAEKDGTPAVTDGPFPESKEFLAGYWIVDVEDLDRAIEVATHISTAPGRDGVPLQLPVEIREVMSAPPIDV
jgi:hypothetical protein